MQKRHQIICSGLIQDSMIKYLEILHQAYFNPIESSIKLK